MSDPNNADRRNIQQHFVPRFYLELFANADHKVCVYDKTNSKVFSGSPASIATERNIYSFKDGFGLFNDGIDSLFDRIEAQSAELVKGLSLDASFKNDDKELLSIFFRCCMCEAPQ